MNAKQKNTAVPGVRKWSGIGRAIRIVMGISVASLVAGPVFAQYPGPPGSTTPSYGSGKAIGIGVGAAAGGALALYLVLHHAGSVTGCVQSGNDGMNLVTDKGKKSYRLLPGDADLQPGERVELQGKKSDAGATGASFQPKKIVKNLGACGASSASTVRPSQSASVQSTYDSPL